MPEPRRQIPPEDLYPRRLAWRAVRMALEQHGLGQMALKLNPDDPTQAFPGAHHGEVLFYEDFAGGRGRPLAAVVLEESRARVTIERIDWLIRPAQRRDFRPAEVGIIRRRDAPDVDATVDLAEVIEVDGAQMRTARQRLLSPASRRTRTPGVIRAFGSAR